MVKEIMQNWWQKIWAQWPIGVAFAFGVFATQWAGHMDLGGHPEMEERMKDVQQRLSIVETQMRYYHPQIHSERQELR